MKTFSLTFQVENADALLTQIRDVYEEMSHPTQRRFIDRMPVDASASYRTGYDDQPVELSRPE